MSVRRNTRVPPRSYRKSKASSNSKYQRTPPESVFTSNSITNQESKEKQHVTTGIRTRASGVPGQRSNQLSYRDFDLESNVTTDIRLGVIILGSAIG